MKQFLFLASISHSKDLPQRSGSQTRDSGGRPRLKEELWIIFLEDRPDDESHCSLLGQPLLLPGPAAPTGRTVVLVDEADNPAAMLVLEINATGHVFPYSATAISLSCLMACVVDNGTTAPARSYTPQ
eukprot:scaffold6852_cov215-Ochromonas_danica.AAC.31